MLGYLLPITDHLTSARHLTTAGHSHSELEFLVTASFSLNDRNMIIRSFLCEEVGLNLRHEMHRRLG